MTAILKGTAALLALSVSTIVLTLFLCLVAMLKLLSPAGPARDRIRLWLAGIAESWVAINSTILGWYRGTEWDIEIPDGLDADGCYLVICNHQSWVDIPVLQRCFNRKLPLLRFFLKSQLIWVPFLGPAWWALDFPFMKRATRDQLARNPGLRGRDLENARKACEKFREIPVAMMSFPEGTRFTPAKQAATGSPYRHLLNPRIGGIGQVLYALAEPLDGLVDVTIDYTLKDNREGAPTLWQLVSGKVEGITVRARRLPVAQELRGRDFREDKGYRAALLEWVETVWREKDELIAGLRKR